MLTLVVFYTFLKHVPNLVTSIHTIGQRVVVSDIQESLFWVRYKRNENQLIIFADDTNPRWVTTACLLDYDTMAAADKFGNISIVGAVAYLLTDKFTYGFLALSVLITIKD